MAKILCFSGSADCRVFNLSSIKLCVLWSSSWEIENLGDWVLFSFVSFGAQVENSRLGSIQFCVLRSSSWEIKNLGDLAICSSVLMHFLSNIVNWLLKFTVRWMAIRNMFVVFWVSLLALFFLRILLICQQTHISQSFRDFETFFCCLFALEFMFWEAASSIQYSVFSIL